MFKITPVQDRVIANKYAKECGIILTDFSFVYAMTNIESGKLMAISEFEIKDGFGYIYNITPIPGLDDFEAMFILGRQTMNFIDLCGTHICHASDKTDEKLLRAIGFISTNDNEFICDMTGFFDGSHCSSHK